MKAKPLLPWLVLVVFSISVCSVSAQTNPTSLNDMQKLGKVLYFDQNLSTPRGQSCASCHHPDAGFADPNTNLATSHGAVPRFFGNRNSPTTTYSRFIPELHYIEMGGGSMGGGGMGVLMGGWTGGLFWDGRANTLQEQAKGPFLNPLEMHNPNKWKVVNAVRHADYMQDFLEVFGPGAFDDVELAYDHIATAIAEYESSSELSPFTSKYDHYAEGSAQLTAQEARGLALFEGAAKCFRCHTTKVMGGGGGMGGGGMGGGGMNNRRRGAMFTTFRYENLGLPKNPENPFYYLPRGLNPAGADYVDLGVGPIVADAAYNGKFRIPSLRNVAVTPPYEHNGIFGNLRELMHFLNTRDVPGANWPPPEVPETVHRHHGDMPADGRILGNLKLTEQEIEDIIAFLQTLTDGYEP